jgi:son of sevenless-like protein
MYPVLRYAVALPQTIKPHTEIQPGVYLTDLTFIEDGIPATIKKSDLINFAKRAKTAEVIREIQTYQNVAYPFKTVPELLEMMIPVINESPDVSDQDTYDLSLKLEPREREDEKIARLVDLGLL